MTLSEAREILRTHNRWMRGADIEMCDPTFLGLAIDRLLQPNQLAKDIRDFALGNTKEFTFLSIGVCAGIKNQPMMITFLLFVAEALED